MTNHSDLSWNYFLSHFNSLARVLSGSRRKASLIDLCGSANMEHRTDLHPVCR